MFNKVILPLWIIGAVSLLLYSFTQIDLSLTLSQASLWQIIQKNFQYIGWFNRPLSTYIYVGIISYLFALYILTLWLVSKNKINKKTLWSTVIVIAAILLPSYNAFSYDLFNYIFDARIVTHYGLNPYEFKALDFANDPMLTFMRSTHRVYPYGPSWLMLTVPLTFIGNEMFLFTFYLFKALSAASFLGITYFIFRIANKINLKNPRLAVALFALNPLVIIEGLVSSHNEIVMMFFAILALYFLLEKRVTLSAAGLLVSIGLKYSTAVLLPIYFLRFISKKITDKQIILSSFILMSIAVIATSLASGQNKNPEFQPWYLLSLTPFAVLYENKFVRILFVSITLFPLFSYVPFLYTGVWPENIVSQKNLQLILAIFFAVIIYLLFSVSKRKS